MSRIEKPCCVYPADSEPHNCLWVMSYCWLTEPNPCGLRSQPGRHKSFNAYKEAENNNFNGLQSIPRSASGYPLPLLYHHALEHS